MARSAQSVNVLARGMLTVYDGSNNPVTGLVNGDFTKFVSRDGADSAVVATVSEVGNGRYTYTFTPTATGYWHLLFRNATYNKRGWEDEFDVS